MFSAFLSGLDFTTNKFCQVYEAGASRRGKLRDRARVSVTTHYDIDPVVDDANNQQAYYDGVASAVRDLLEGSKFHKGLVDEEVHAQFITDMLLMLKPGPNKQLHS